MSTIDGLTPAAVAAIDARAREIGREIFRDVPAQRPGIFNRHFWGDYLMDLSMRDERLKVELFRFVDVLPMLKTSDSITGHLVEYLGNASSRLSPLLCGGLQLVRRTPGVRDLVARAARAGSAHFARRFIAGTNVKEVLAAAKSERKLGRAFTLDILGEAVTSDREAEGYFRAYCELLERISPVVNEWPENQRLDSDANGLLPRMNLSVKLSALDSQFDAIDFHGTAERVARGLRELLRVARANGAFINIDMESYEKKDLTLHIFKSVLLEEEFRDVSDVGIVVQCYLRDSDQDLAELRDWAAKRGTPVWVRLVKGAYWDHETIRAKYHDWPIPVFQEKWQSDACYERATRFVMQNVQHLRPAIASHNIRSLSYAVAAAELCGVPNNGFEIQMLYGMADAQKKVLVERGHRLRVYMPYGELIPGMAYLVRRLLENTSDDSFLRMSYQNRVPVEHLLRDPTEVGQQSIQASSTGLASHSTTNSLAVESFSMMATDNPPRSAFENEPPVDFTKAENREAMLNALRQVREQLHRNYPLVIGGERIETAKRLESVDPSQKSRIVGVTSAGEVSHAEQAVATAKQALPAWAAIGVKERADFLRAAADEMRRRKFELSAWAVFECGKPWREATGDIDEAIDFCNYYAAGAVAMHEEAGADLPGEENRFIYAPRGVVGVIAPWNFPLAILTGMTAAALVTGNTVIMKPAEQSAIIAAKLMEVFESVGLPRGVLNYLPGRGEIVGAALVEHPDVSLIAFTGSRAVGLAINEKAAEVSRRSSHDVKRVIAEMGGKNAIIVDDDADLDEAVIGVMKSAFGYAGQKCSACSRAVVLNSVFEPFLERLIEASRSLKVGPAEDPATSVGPVIDDEAYQRILKYVDIGRSEGRPVLETSTQQLTEQGYFIGPHIFADVAPNSRIAQEEIFGPVLAVIRANDLDDALAIANGTEYALTGGMYSRSPAHLQRASREFQVGNLYLNRGITGALVARQPFGGFRMSGIGSKAGGPDYLYQFVVPRTITENTMRRGFAPPAE